MKIQRALISVSDKTGIVEFATALAGLGIELLSTGGTAALLAKAGLKVTEVADHTGFPEMLDGRVKTLHPRIHGGLLARREVNAHMQALAEHDIPTIDLLIVNLYPFEATVAQPGCTLEDAIENIDIGGPAMVRSAAKNWRGVGVLTDAAQYPCVLEELRGSGTLSDATRFALSIAAFNRISNYDAAISDYLSSLNPDGTRVEFPAQSNGRFVKVQDLRYGENPHQRAAFYRDLNPAPGSLVSAKQLQGKELSYNNIADTDAALECVKSFVKPACVIVKHANPCGVALGGSLLEAYERAFSTDPESAFGGIIAFNQELDAATASAIAERQFVEVIIAPRVSAAARDALATKKNVRVLECGPWSGEAGPRLDFKCVNGGLLVQDTDLALYDGLRTVTRRAPSETELTDLRFTWRVAKFVKSNAIVYGRDGMTIGVGAGQMSRVNSARIAVIKAEQAGLAVRGAVMASDAFFPFRDGIDQAAAAGITAVIQPGGSLRDEETIAAADEHGMAMVFTGMRHFRH